MLRICQDCTAAYAVGVPLCPHCGSERAVDEGTDPYRGDTMPKINAAGEATYAADVRDAVLGEERSDAGGYDEDAEPLGPAPGMEEPSPGTSSPTPTGKRPTSGETSSTGRPRRARTTGSRSKKTPAGDSSAASTDTAGPVTDGSDPA
ncbi:hypothetical protein VSR01_10740 [Actinacidiphila sp. DG2A-62]|uniref:hypothetical protein n=1 Tax=Actinacidiphila sp. DG2A-62 TaxID=3108821 RepID=UPI002DBBB2A0|nr:hypothetical protein [Actinacidiphila sp. DG2A-62]MEC3993995.1 hypothetical protein [Actinacidiphila sp. DG2A-62]